MDSSAIPIRVVKLGGSLLNYVLTPIEIERWVSRQPPMTTVWIVGGGPLVDSVRQLDGIHRFATDTTHWISFDLMDVTSKFLAAWFPQWPVVGDLNNLTDATSPNIIFSPGNWLSASPSLLPISWDVSSDSVAAKLASALNAKEVVLLKSAAPPHGDGVLADSEHEWVDPHFQTIARNLVVRWVNLRDPAYPEGHLICP